MKPELPKPKPQQKKISQMRRRCRTKVNKGNEIAALPLIIKLCAVLRSCCGMSKEPIGIGARLLYACAWKYDLSVRRNLVDDAPAALQPVDCPDAKPRLCCTGSGLRPIKLPTRCKRVRQLKGARNSFTLLFQGLPLSGLSPGGYVS